MKLYQVWLSEAKTYDHKFLEKLKCVENIINKKRL
jgi:hypothetical protein